MKVIYQVSSVVFAQVVSEKNQKRIYSCEEFNEWFSKNKSTMSLGCDSRNMNNDKDFG